MLSHPPISGNPGKERRQREDPPRSDTCLCALMQVVTIGRNLRSVLIPIKWGEFSNRDHALRNWDLWGPLVSLAHPLSDF